MREFVVCRGSGAGARLVLFVLASVVTACGTPTPPDDVAYPGADATYSDVITPLDGSTLACPPDAPLACAYLGHPVCLAISEESCGACGRRCAGTTPVCMAGRCVPCPSPRAWCDGENACIDVRTDPRHCGACGQACEDGAPCANGRCVPCPVGTGRCGRAACQSLDSDRENCGACGSRCPAVGQRAASAVCTAGRCRVTCIAGTAECDGDERTICETTTLADDAHCGACGHACGPAATCVSGRCVAWGVRPRAPISIEALRSTRPTLHWVLGPGTTGARIELCTTRDCEVIEHTWEVTGTRFRVPGPLSPGFHFWRLYALRGATVDATPGPTWGFSVPPHPTEWQQNGIDLNGDGFPDVVHAAYLGSDLDLGQPNPDVGIEYGTASGSIPSNGVVDDRLRFHGIGAVNGDVDCDGYGDFVHYTAVRVGIAGPAGYLSGRALGLSWPFDWNDYSRGSDADFNGDGCVDRLLPPSGAFLRFEVISSARIDPGLLGLWAHSNVPAARVPATIDDDGYDDVRWYYAYPVWT